MKNEKLRIAVLALVMMWGMGVGAQEQVYKVLTFPSQSSNITFNDYSHTWEASIDDFTWEIKNFNNYQNSSTWTYIKCGKKASSSSSYILTTSPIDKAIVKVKVNITEISTKAVNSISLIISEDKDFSEGLTEYKKENISSGELEFSIPSAKSNQYYKLVFDCNNKETNNGYVVVSKVAYYTSPFISISHDYATFYSEYPYVMPDGLTGYTIEAVNNDKEIQLTASYPQNSIVPAHEALLIKGSNGTYKLSYGTTDENPISGNLLHGTSNIETISGEGSYYKFSYDSYGDNLGFYWQTADGTSITNAANRCYLLIPTTSGIKAFTLSDLFNTEEETSIINTTLPHRDSNAYSLTGLPVSPAYRGIVIKDGKKILRK